MIFWTLVAGLMLLIWLLRLNKKYYVSCLFAPRLRTVDGRNVEDIVPTMPGKMILGNTFDTMGMDYAQTFKYLRHCAAVMKRSYVQNIIGITLLNVIDAELAEIIFTDTRLIKKGFVYNYLRPALGDGLLNSTDKKWHSRRKMLTPAFHFNILQQFHDIFREESKKFIETLDNMDASELVLDEVIPKLTLNVVCETALGVKLDECLNGDDYRKNFCIFENYFNRRVNNGFLMIDAIFKLVEGTETSAALKVVHEFSSDIIKKKRELCAKEQKEQQSLNNNDDNDGFDQPKKRYAMLDTLLRAEQEGLIDHAGICEEVDTFMFEGYDTTSMGLIFGLLNLSLYPDVQERCYQEIMENITDMELLEIAQINKLKYMDCFIKESMRLYPSVPVIMREAPQEITLSNGIVLPPKTAVTIHIFDIHRNPKYYKNPDVFDPERFTPENSTGRHPYAYVPFSAGQRNCIGQKFAMLEMKTLLVNVIKKYKILPLVDPKSFEFKSGIIIRTKNDVKVKLVKRQ